MQVFLIRHAAAVDETVALRDPQRYLTAQGRSQASELGERLRWHDCEPTHLWSSPLVRAVQTAELVAAGLHSPIAVEIVPALAPDSDVRAVIAAVRALPADACVVVVGHEPALSAIGAVLAGAEDFAALAKAEAVRLVDGAVRWRFAWNDDAPRAAS
ncbi:MAG TPA: phosphohistidine phosphatase SixA [Kofleriaceae bacterium]|nr:phosphohistidine phosphatase SixA [Kofleriaceae bacterium]